MTADGPLYEKYLVTRKEGDSGKHIGCDYFVLDITHDPFALPALSAYANAAHRTHPELAAALRGKIIEREKAG